MVDNTAILSKEQKVIKLVKGNRTRRMDNSSDCQSLATGNGPEQLTDITAGARVKA
jgi:hypothetical protein